jgi:hypothetical protein
LLAFGAPLGEFVLGGKYIVFPKEMRIINVIFFMLWLFIGLLYLIKGNLINNYLNGKIITIILVTITLFMVYAIYGNWFITESIKEKYLMTPLAMITSISSIMLLIMSSKKIYHKKIR